VIDEVAVYNHELTPARILAHYAVGIRSIVFTPQSLTFPAQPAGSATGSPNCATMAYPEARQWFCRM
jgi:hypothetical protein